jgi:hypothetical protein
MGKLQKLKRHQTLIKCQREAVMRFAKSGWNVDIAVRASAIFMK